MVHRALDGTQSLRADRLSPRGMPHVDTDQRGGAAATFLCTEDSEWLWKVILGLRGLAVTNSSPSSITDTARDSFGSRSVSWVMSAMRKRSCKTRSPACCVVGILSGTFSPRLPTCTPRSSMERAQDGGAVPSGNGLQRHWGAAALTPSTRT